MSPEASGLARRETGRVAVVVPRIDIWFYATMLASIERVLQAADLDVLVYQVDGEEERRRFFEQLPARRKVDAAVLIALPLQEREVDRLELLGVEVVVAGGRLRDHPRVEVDDHEIALTAMRHLLDLGHRRIAHDPHQRHRSWRSTRRTSSAAGATTRPWQRPGIDFRDEYLVTMPFGLEAGARGMDRLLALPEPPTAVFAFTDEVALSALRSLVSRGVDIPAGMSVIGVDDHPHAELIGLTTVAQGIAEQGRLSGEMAVRLLRGEGAGGADRRGAVPADRAGHHRAAALTVGRERQPCPSIFRLRVPGIGRRCTVTPLINATPLTRTVGESGPMFGATLSRPWSKAPMMPTPSTITLVCSLTMMSMPAQNALA